MTGKGMREPEPSIQILTREDRGLPVKGERFRGERREKRPFRKKWHLDRFGKLFCLVSIWT